MKYAQGTEPQTVHQLNVKELPIGVIHRLRVVMTENATGNETLIPVIVVRGADPDPVIGLTAAVHGNELNGIPVIHRLLESLDEGDDPIAKGTIVCVPIVNIPGYLRQQREFEDGVDLNRVMPGNPDGDESKLYANRFIERIVKNLDYLIDLHTASFGRVNSLYVRADMDHPEAARLARLLAPQIIVHSPGSDGTLRAAASALGIVSITVEVGDPQRFQRGLIRATRLGLEDVLGHLGIAAAPTETGDNGDSEAIECGRSFWLYTDRGGILSIFPSVTDRVSGGEKVAELRNVWGEPVRTYVAPQDGIVVGRATNPAARAGSRIIHLGIPR